MLQVIFNKKQLLNSYYPLTYINKETKHINKRNKQNNK